MAKYQKSKMPTSKRTKKTSRPKGDPDEDWEVRKYLMQQKFQKLGINYDQATEAIRGECWSFIKHSLDGLEDEIAEADFEDGEYAGGEDQVGLAVSEVIATVEDGEVTFELNNSTEDGFAGDSDTIGSISLKEFKKSGWRAMWEGKGKEHFIDDAVPSIQFHAQFIYESEVPYSEMPSEYYSMMKQFTKEFEKYDPNVLSKKGDKYDYYGGYKHDL